jgi:hypothetical protein
MLYRSYLVGIIYLTLALLFSQCKDQHRSNSQDRNSRTSTSSDPAGNPSDRDEGFDRRVSLLEYSHHAQCRMDCRHISKGEVNDIMLHGHINDDKSDLNNPRCPRYAMEGYSDDKKLRIIFAQCGNKTEVVTVIELGREWQCDCPGDENKHHD